MGFAVVLLAAIYFWGRKGSREGAKRTALTRERPELALFADDPPAENLPATELLAWSNDTGTEEAPAAIDDWRIERGAPDTRTYAEPQPEEWTPAQPAGRRGEGRRERVEPTLSDAYIDEVPPDDVPAASFEPATAAVEPEVEAPSRAAYAAPESAAESAAVRAEERVAPTLSSADTPPPKRVERRKILALRLAAAPHRIEGSRLQEVFAAEGLQHGKYSIFHLLHEDGTSIFSVASMVEPGTFDLETMPQTQYPGVTLFAQLPGPVPGMHALNELVACARRLQQSLGGTLQDDRGVPLTVHRIERMRQEVREFERAARV